MTTNETVAGQIRYYSARSGMRLGELASRAEIHPAALSRRLQGRPSFKIGELARIAEVLGIPTSRLLEDAETLEDAEPAVLATGTDPLDLLEEQGISIAWVRDMEHSALYLSNDRIMVLNSQCEREELGESVTALLAEPPSNN